MSGVGKRTIESAEDIARSLGRRSAGHLEKPFQLAALEAVLRSPPTPQVLPEVSIDSNFAILKEELQNALTRNEFVVYYQPQIDIQSGRVIGVEALVRWQHPTRGLVFPDNFIGQMEEFGLIDQLGWVVANRGMIDVGKIAKCGSKDFMLSLNASVNSLCDLAFP